MTRPRAEMGEAQVPESAAVRRRPRGLQLWAALACAGMACVVPAVGQLKQLPLNDGWQFRAVQQSEHPEATAWHAAAVPGVVQTDLQRNGMIPDPFFGDNEKRLQWIGDTDWQYTRELDVSPAMLRHSHVELVFAGLDTFADVAVNDHQVLAADNQFRSWRVDAKPFLHVGRNEIRIRFHSPTRRVTEMVAKLPYIIPGTGYEKLDRAAGVYPVSHYMRKAPYSYGWDWGPKFVTEGIWKPVSLEMWDGARAESFHVSQDSVTAERAVLEASLKVRADVSGAATLQVQVTTPEGRALPTVSLPERVDAGENVFRVPMRIEHPERWFPNGYGAQSRYRFKATLRQGARVLASGELRTGLRSVELRRERDEWGTSFFFVVNGIPVFAKGANVVPLDSFAPQITDERRRAVLTAARDVHMNMLRIWGGGYYETDAFYDLCDELGLLVWQDFMFGGAMVPGDKPFQDNVRAEAVEQVERLSDHPSLALWCGNNEVETAWKGWSDQHAFQKSVTPEQRERVWQDYVVMFRDILKGVVAEHGNHVPYWPSTPGSNFEDVPAGQLNGDEHSWSVWSAGAPITDYRKVNARFVSEFGFQSMPDLQTVRSYAGSDEDLSSPALANHERFIHGYDRMQGYLKQEFRPAKDFAAFVYLSQLMQAEAIKLGVEDWRSKRPRTMGALYWQLNDCWPVASWSSIDYYGRWKALQFYAKRFYAPLLVAAETDGKQVKLHVVSDELAARSAVLHVRLLRFDGSLVQEEREPVVVAALASTAVPAVSLPDVNDKSMFLVLTLEQGAEVLASNTVYFAKSGALELPKAEIAHSLRASDDGFVLELHSPVLARAVHLRFGELAAKPEDNFFDLLPNQARQVRIRTKASMHEVEAALQIQSLVDAMQPMKPGE